jgi:peptide chain release factor 1
MGVIIEIRGAEGGADAKLLVEEQLMIYTRLAVQQRLTLEVVEIRPGFAALHADGPRAAQVFANESGGHRWQRIPPTEKRGRVHTSTITVAVLPEPTEVELRLNPADLDWQTCRGSGAGGQHRNVTASAVQLTYRPTKLMVRCESERSQQQNRRTALTLLRAKLWEAQRAAVSQARASDRRQQVGSGMRGDKRRTIRVQDGQVHDHLTGQRWRYRDYVRGDWEVKGDAR